MERHEAGLGRAKGGAGGSLSGTSALILRHHYWDPKNWNVGQVWEEQVVSRLGKTISGEGCAGSGWSSLQSLNDWKSARTDIY